MVTEGPTRVPGRLRGRIAFADDFEETPEWLVGAFEGVAG